ncbi:unnamed protein product [Prorocentrum cordatum]|uniref:TIR domain-containing protein n=1 Tax=Prorocentrum cordatum TaxID=2364126 RepID=A0ABN9TUJ5_9DINO|nr:unnamed protein product [Polarella glacialis]
MRGPTTGPGPAATLGGPGAVPVLLGSTGPGARPPHAGPPAKAADTPAAWHEEDDAPVLPSGREGDEAAAAPAAAGSARLCGSDGGDAALCKVCKRRISEGEDNDDAPAPPIGTEDGNAAAAGDPRTCSLDCGDTTVGRWLSGFGRRDRQKQSFERLLSSESSLVRLLRLSGALDPEMRSDITFSDPSLLRGTRACDVLRRRGEVLHNSAGTERHYAMSRRVEAIDVFVSHNWCTPRAQKFRALSVFFSLDAVVLLVGALSLSMASLQAAGVLPVLDMLGDDGQAYRSAEYGVVSGTLVLFLGLHLLQDIRALLPFGGATVFLDKTCIDQVDEDRKRHGIESLAAFVRHSRCMVVVYSDSYLHKLWTVYELACFLTLHKKDKLHVIPVILPSVLAMGVVTILVVCLCDMVVHIAVVREALVGMGLENTACYLTFAVAFPFAVAFCIAWRNWLRVKARIEKQSENFSIHQAECFNEADRPLVKRSIARFMKVISAIAKDATDEAALDAFDKKVRTEMPKALAQSVGKAGVRYKHVVVIFLPLALQTIDGAGILMREGASARKVGLHIMGGWVVRLAVYPLMIPMLTLLMGLSLRLKSGAAILSAATAAAALVLAASMELSRVIQYLEQGAVHSDSDLRSFAVASFVCCSLVGACYFYKEDFV